MVVDSWKCFVEKSRGFLKGTGLALHGAVELNFGCANRSSVCPSSIVPFTTKICVVTRTIWTP